MYSVIHIIDALGLVFVQDEHKDLGKWTGEDPLGGVKEFAFDEYGDEYGVPERVSAKEYAEYVKKQLTDPTGLNIPEARVKIHENKTKSEIEAIFESIKAEEGVHLGVFVICLGFFLHSRYQKDLYAEVDAELDERFAADFNFCSDGGLVCYNMLTAKLTNYKNISCLLISEFDR